MNYIAREKKELKQLSDTERKFKNQIKGLTKSQAYQFYKDHKGSYQYNTPETKAEFAKMNYKRCSFCTKYISDFNKEMTVEHIETKSDCPEKIFRWDNLLCACRTCNTERGTKKYAENIYLDPTKIMEIEKYFCFHADGTISANKALNDEEVQKAENMIRLYNLDREELNADRRAFFQDLLDDTFFHILQKKDKASQDIHFLAVFTYYNRRMEHGK